MPATVATTTLCLGTMACFYLVALNNVISTHETTRNKHQGQDNNLYVSWCPLNHFVFGMLHFLAFFLDSFIAPIDISFLLLLSIITVF